ncbi:hypothetical protein GCM10010168_87300 [Actinoplanes ianthinogenes]|uniref:EcsC family protein n=1 Tax=Actinoplanes ianthinogenes TaxID=122358 RepID=A0ABM7LSP1_9ACTN|nr:hypothetical protein [Actinoplanes ianthinogenes]BCJ42271.1 hypothetical protein Aiant_29280 [Actinoplanes ianthinogenes]GGR54829.1 hypothetical protein GCM10010168_87300 [Actinoplanes ianthinogenes]
MSQPDRVPDSAVSGADPLETPAQAQADEELGRTVAALTGDDLEPAGRRRLLGRLVGDVRRRGLSQAFKPRAALRWMADVVADVAPHVPVRSRETLRRHFPGMDDDALAERLIRNAARATAGVGAAGGGIASIEWAAAPTLLSAPVLLSAETITVVAIELKLIGELHELYGDTIAGNGTERAFTLIQSWAGQRGVNPMLPGVAAASVLSTATRRDLQKRLLHRFGRNLTSFGPMLTGAAVASYLNRRATIAVGERVRDDLKKQMLKSPKRRELDD